MRLSDHLTENLSRAVGNVCEAALEIWSVPKHAYYTDHSVTHSDRLITKLDELTRGVMHSAQPLSGSEIYILLAAAYLHDIGMQNERSEGGDLESIRKVHEEISYQMIVGSLQNPERYRSLNLLPEPDIVEAVGWVSKGHRKTPLDSDHYEEFRLGDDLVRPRLLAALLRLADSLDIDCRRVVMENLKLAEIPIESRYHWHRCYYVVGVSVVNELIQIWFRLPQGRGYEHILVSPVLREIDDELTRLASILRLYGAKLALGDPQIRYSELVGEMPPEVLRYAQQVLEESAEERITLERSSSPLDSLTKELIFWVRAIGYKILGQQRLNDWCTEVTAEKRDKLTSERVLLHCIDGEVDPAKVHFLENATSEKSIQVGWIVSDKRVANSARVYASQRENIRVLTMADLLNGIFGDYFQYLKQLAEDSGIASYYVGLSCEKPVYDEDWTEIARDKYPVIDDYIDKWLEERGKNHISILGEFGTGKTWFCRHFAYRQLQRFLESPTNQRMPFFINLRDYRSEDLEQLITGLLINRYKIRISGYEAFDRLNRSGRLLILFDGFDEMSMRVDDAATIRNFEALARTAVPGGKVLLTCRTPYFRDYMEASRILTSSSVENTFSEMPKFEILYLCEFDDEQIKEVLRKRVPEKWTQYWAQIRNIFDLPNLAQRPVLLDMIITTLPDLEGLERIDHATIYKTFTDKWIEESISETRTLLDADSKRFFAQEVAWEMFKNGSLTVGVLEIRELVKYYLRSKLRRAEDIVFLEHDVRTASFISKRDELGNYEFMHRSFMEFFVAQKLATAIKRQESHPLGEQEIYYEIIRFLNQMLDPDTDWAKLASWRDDPSSNPVLRTNCIRISGQWTDENTVCSLLRIIENHEASASHRRDAIRSVTRIFHGEEADWSDIHVEKKLHAFAIRTGRDDLKVACLPIEIKILRPDRFSEATQKLRQSLVTKFVDILLRCLCEPSEAEEIRINASYAMTHFATERMEELLYDIARNDGSPYVRFNCCVALLTLNSAFYRKAVEQLVAQSKDPQLIEMARVNLSISTHRIVAPESELADREICE